MTTTRGICTHPHMRRGKLTIEQVGEIKARLDSETDATLAHAYSVHKTTINSIRIGRSYPEIPATHYEGDTQ